MVLRREGVALLQLRAAGGMALAMADTEILADEGAVAVWKVAAEDLFGSVWEGQYHMQGSRLRGRSAMWTYGSTGVGRDVQRGSSFSRSLRGCIRICGLMVPGDCAAGAWRVVRLSQP